MTIDVPSVTVALGAIAVSAPAALVATLGIASLLNQPFSERAIGRLGHAAITFGLLATLAVLAVMLAGGERHVVIDLGNWVAVEHPSDPGHRTSFHLHFKLVFDRLSVPMVILTFALCGTIGAFAVKYLHREGGFNRFFVLYSLFVLGMVVASLAGTIETLFAGWELVGLSSALLVAFFHDRPAPSRNGLWVWGVYRLSDASLLLAAVAMHHMSGEGDFATLLGANPAHPWPEGHAVVSSGQALGIGLLLLFAAAGKSALVPFSGWLSRAMEGPTPSSAVFYGALSVHLGAYLLLRVGPLLAASDLMAAMVVAFGCVTALLAYHVASVQTDVKSALSFAALVQVGLIVAEIGLGCWWNFLWYVALVHLLGHACLRTLQFVRAPSALQDVRSLENAIGGRLPAPGGPWHLAPGSLRLWLYRFALERGYLDTVIAEHLAGPFVRLFRWLDRMEVGMTNRINGEVPDRSERPSTCAATPKSAAEPQEAAT